MAILTSKLDAQLEDIRTARHGLPIHLAHFIQFSVMMARRHADEFGSRAELQNYANTLKDLITTKVNSR